MLPEVDLRNVSRIDVDRIGSWLEDSEVASMWFGQVACGDALHRGYQPRQMLESDDAEWRRVFDDSKSLIRSIYSAEHGHIGESQLLFDKNQEAELLILIGRKDLWHLGYGTAVLLSLLDEAFRGRNLRRVWVSVPNHNVSACSLFRKLGFKFEESRVFCDLHNEPVAESSIFGMDRSFLGDYKSVGDACEGVGYLVSVTGLPGSGFDLIGRSVARRLGCQFFDQGSINEILVRKLGYSLGELQDFVRGHGSFLERFVRNFGFPFERSWGYDPGYVWFADSVGLDGMWGSPLTKAHYLRVFASMIQEVHRNCGVVSLGNGGSHLVGTRVSNCINVLINSHSSDRVRKIASERGIADVKAESLMEQNERESKAIAKNLYGVDVVDLSCYDIVLNLGFMSEEDAVDLIVARVVFFVRESDLRIVYEESTPESSTSFA